MWIARGKEGYLVGFNHKPIRTNYDECGFYGWTIDNKCIPINDVVNMQVQLSHIMLPRELFPELTWEDEPIECIIVSKNEYQELQGELLEHRLKEMKLVGGVSEVIMKD